MKEIILSVVGLVPPFVTFDSIKEFQAVFNLIQKSESSIGQAALLSPIELIIGTGVGASVVVTIVAADNIQFVAIIASACLAFDNWVVITITASDPN